MKTFLALIILSLAGVLPASAVSFATNRLQTIARCLRLTGLDSLQAGTHDTYRYQSHALSIRVNSFGEVEHIGLRLFPNTLKANNVSPVYDFLERNLLERLMPNLDDSLKFHQGCEHVDFLAGRAQSALQIDTTDIVGFSEERTDFHTYHVCWSRKNRKVLELSFPMDFQLLSGCNGEELEILFMRRLLRFQPHAYEPRKFLFPRHTNTYVAAGDTFLIREMRNELFYEKDKSGWHLTDSAAVITKVLSNMLLSMEFAGNPTLTLSFDRYSEVKGEHQVPYKHWLQMCLDEGCSPFLGVKSVTPDSYKCTVLMTNPRSGYVHLLSVTVPQQTLLHRGNGDIRGYIYPYIPMHHITSDYFKP